jgi:hypothetical protein
MANRSGQMDKKDGLVRASEILPEVLPASLFDKIIRPDDIGYTHPVFMQCFLSTHHSEKNPYGQNIHAAWL